MQLDPPLKLVTPLGRGLCYFMEDGPCGVEWQVFILKTGESWWFINPFIRMEPSVTLGVENSPFTNLPANVQRQVDRYKQNGWL